MCNIQGNTHRVIRLCEWLSDNDKEPDLVLSCGNITNLSQEEKTQTSKVSAAEGDISVILAILEGLVPRVIFHPGPRDPSTLLQDISSLGSHSQSTRQVVKILDDLVVFGEGVEISTEENKDFNVEQSISSLIALSTQDNFPALQGVENTLLQVLSFSTPKGVENTQRPFVEWKTEGSCLLYPGDLSSNHFALVTLNRPYPIPPNSSLRAWQITSVEFHKLHHHYTRDCEISWTTEE